MKQLLVLAVFFSFLLGGYNFYKNEQKPEQTVGSFAPVGGTTYRLQSSIGLANTSLTLASFRSRSGIPWTMSMLNTDIVYATLDPQTTNSEFISFTGIVQNSDGTATISGITRGLSDFYPYTASTTMQRPHAGQAIFILSDPPQLFNEYAAKRNNNVFTDYNYFTSGTGFGTAATSSDECSAANEYCTKQYIDAGLNQGAATSTETNIGLVELATNTEIAAGTASSSAGGPLVPPNKYFKSSQTSCNSIACIPVAVSGKISQLFLDLTQHFNFTSIFATSASSTNATSTTSHYFPFVTSSMLKTDSAGKLSAATAGTDYLQPRRILASTTSIVSASPASCSNSCSNSAFGTSTQNIVLASGVLNASSTITLVAGGDQSGCSTTGNASCSCSALLRTSTGATVASFQTVGNSTTGYGNAIVSFTGGSLSSQIITTTAQRGSTSVFGSTAGTVNLTGAVTLTLVSQATVSSGVGESASMTSCSITGYTLVVNP